MVKLTMCRICLVENVSMYEVANKDLQETYEKLTDVPFVTEDLRPMLACFFCYVKLKQCCQLQRKCLKAEEVFAQMLNGGYEQIPIEYQGEIEFCGGFIKTPIEHMSIDDVCLKESGAIRAQVPTACDSKDDIMIEVKQEYQINEVKVEYEEDSYQDQEAIPSHHSASDSEDDVPLTTFKTEVEEEQEVPEENTRAPVAKKTYLHNMWKAKLEDTITHKQIKIGSSDSEIDHATRNRTSKSEPTISDTIAKPSMNDSILYQYLGINKESQNKDLINTAIDMSNCNNSIKYDFRCKICNYKGKCDIFDINRHKNSCTKNKLHNCDVCQRSFIRKANLDSHILIHTGEKPYKCDICQLSFSQKLTLKSHVRKHTGEKPYKCDICQLSFSQRNHLKSHISTHTGDKRYKCDICQRSFNREAFFKRHVRIHTDENPYKCDVCQRSFSKKSYLSGHILTHTGIKPFKCDTCQRSFLKKCHLDDHNRTHTGEKPYKCDICHQGFSARNNLTKHIRKHTGEKPYQCDICQRSFTQKAHLKLHVERLHP